MFYFFTTQNLGAVAAELFYKSVLGLCLTISRAARYLPNPAINNIPSLCVYFDLYGNYLPSVCFDGTEYFLPSMVAGKYEQCDQIWLKIASFATF